MSEISDWFGRELTLGVATDHGGFEQKQRLLEHLQNRRVDVRDLGPDSYDPADDYPPYACRLAREVANGNVDCGILICKTGIGMSMAANRFHGVRAALVEIPEKARLAREHNASNILVTGGTDMTDQRLFDIVDTWLDTPYSGEERHTRRLQQIECDAYDDTAPVRHVDPDVAAILDAENRRQEEGIELIASENFASAAVRAATGSVMTNKYAEGYPRKRYYNGCECVDDIEELAVARACKLFAAESDNVQPHSCIQAKMSV